MQALMLAVIALLDQSAPPKAKAMDSSPESVIRAFAAAITRGDLREGSGYVLGGRYHSGLKQMEEEIKAAPFVLTVSEVKVTPKGDFAVADLQVLPRNPKRAQQTRSARERLNLRRQNGAWKIVPPARRAPAAAGQRALQSLAALTLALAPPRANSAANACISNVKLVCNGMLLYLSDSRGSFRMSRYRLQERLAPYVQRESAFTCPQQPRGTSSYSFNNRLRAFRMDSVDDPAETVMFYEGDDEQLDFRHSGMAVVGFADGSVRLLTPEQARELRWDP